MAEGFHSLVIMFWNGQGRFQKMGAFDEDRESRMFEDP